MRRLRLLFLVFSMTTVISAQAPLPLSDPQAVTLAAKSVAALTGGSVISDVTLNGTVTRIAGSDQQNGTVTLLAKGLVASRADLNLSGGTRSEIRNTANGLNQGNWIGVDGTVHPISLHNCLTDPNWFFPALGSLAGGGNSTLVLSYIGLENLGQTSVQHIHAYTYNASWPETKQLGAMDFYLDPQTFLPTIVTFNEHADNDQTVNIAVAVMFSDYRNVGGATIPFHIQRYVNNGLMLDIQLASASLNSGIPDSQFKLQ